MAALRILQFGVVFAVGYQLCPASLSAGVVLSSDVPLSLQLLAGPADVVVGRGQSATLRCDAHSDTSTPPRITWLHNGQPIAAPGSAPSATSSVSSAPPPSSNVTTTTRAGRIGNNKYGRAGSHKYVQRSDGSLYLPKVTSGGGAAGKKGGLAGEYRCRVANERGAILSGPARLRVASLDREFSREPDDQSVPESQPVVFFCNIHSVPSATIAWEFNTEPLPHNSRYVPFSSGALLIKETHSSDAGSYRCIATNYLLLNISNHNSNSNNSKKTQRVSRAATLTVTSRPTQQAPPTILQLPPQVDSSHVDYVTSSSPWQLLNMTSGVVVAMEGDTVEFYCSTTGWPNPTVQWLNNDSSPIGDTSSPLLRLANLTIAHAGNYTCSAHNRMGHAHRRHTLEVWQPPRFNVTPTSKSYPLAGTARFDCQALGVPKPRVHWLVNGSKLAVGGNVRVLDDQLLLSQTFSYNAGIYQCVATSAGGVAWAAAELVLPPAIPPPMGVECRPFDNKRICLSWRSPRNVTVTGYSVVYLRRDDDGDSKIRESVTTADHFLIEGLTGGKNYTFFVRVYVMRGGSDESERVTCETGVVGKRQLKVTPVNQTSVELSWSEVSYDFTCTGIRRPYNVQWRSARRKTPYTARVDNTRYLIQGIAGSHDFRVTATDYREDDSPWVTYDDGSTNRDPPDRDDDYDDDNNYETKDKEYGEYNEENGDSGEGDDLPPPLIGGGGRDQQQQRGGGTNASANGSDEIELRAPNQVEATPTGPNDVHLSWLDANLDTEFFTVCHVVGVTMGRMKVKHGGSGGGGKKHGGQCDKSNTVTSVANSVDISGLKSNTLYEFRVRAHSVHHYGPYSEVVQLRTPLDVPSQALNLEYKVINTTAVCLSWRPPAEAATMTTDTVDNTTTHSLAPTHSSPSSSKIKLLNYIISYTPDRNWPLETWNNKSIPSSPPPTTSGNCHTWPSILLDNLKPHQQYLVYVRAVSRLGVGRPSIPLQMSTTPDDLTPPPVIVKNSDSSSSDSTSTSSSDSLKYNTEFGIILGVGVAALCVICCVSCILVRRRCLKNRAVLRAGPAAAGATPPNCYSSARYAAGEGSCVRVRLAAGSDDALPGRRHEAERLVGGGEGGRGRGGGGEEDLGGAGGRVASIGAMSNHHLDTKGTDDGFPNGHANGGGRMMVMANGGALHITENPRCFRFDDLDADPETDHHHPTSTDLNTSKFHDLHRLFEQSKQRKPPPDNPRKLFKMTTQNGKKPNGLIVRNNNNNNNHQGNGAAVILDDSLLSTTSDHDDLNSTEVTLLDCSRGDGGEDKSAMELVGGVGRHCNGLIGHQGRRSNGSGGKERRCSPIIGPNG